MHNNAEHNGSCSCGFVNILLMKPRFSPKHVIVMIVKNQQVPRLSSVQ